MKKVIAAVILALVLSGCANMSPKERKTAGIIVGVLVIGAIAAGGSSGSSPVDTCNDYITYPGNSGVYIPPCP